MSGRIQYEVWLMALSLVTGAWLMPVSYTHLKGSGYYISRGISVDSLDTSRKWDTHMVVKKGDRLMPGTIIAEVPETRAITHKVMVPPDVEGYVLEAVPDGQYTIEETLLTVQLMDGSEKTLTMTQKRCV